MTVFCPVREASYEVTVVMPSDERIEEIQQQLGELLVSGHGTGRGKRIVKLSAATSLAWLIAVVALFAGSGASCQRPLTFSPFAAAGPPAPQVLPEAATREQIIAAVNTNSSRVRSITATSASITIPDTMNLPILTANIAAERPNRVRITAGTAITGQEMDVGSNDQLFWMWVRRNQPPAVYFCRHDQFANSAIRQMMPVEPAWLLSAIGHDRDRSGAASSTDRCRAATARSRCAPMMPSASGNAAARDGDRRPPGVGRRAACVRSDAAGRCWRARSPSRISIIRPSRCRCRSESRCACRRRAWR